jgi:RNA polymerase sigma-70 factor (ECF subfamily)
MMPAGQGDTMTRSDNQLEQTLITRIAAGDEWAIEVLYERYKRQVFGLALHVLRDSESAEEVTLDVFFRVWTQASGFRAERASVKTWLISIARNAAIDRLRRRSSRPDENIQQWADDALETLPAESSVEGEVLDREIRQKVQAAIKGLPVEHQQVLALAYFEGLSHGEIARKLNQPLGTVKSRLRSAMSRLRELLTLL